ncbi:hypothetical protein CL643_01705 [bacterium]|nr:hypothetical protein [bacterium]
MELISFRRGMSIKIGGTLEKLLQSKTIETIGFLIPLLALSAIGYVFSVLWQYGSMITTNFVALSLLFFVLLGFTALNMGHLILSHQGNLLLRALPLSPSDFAKAKLFVLFIFGVIWSVFFNLPSVIFLQIKPIINSGLNGSAVFEIIKSIIGLCLVSISFTAFTQSFTILFYSSLWRLKIIRPHISWITSMMMVSVLGAFVIWSSTGHTDSLALRLDLDPGAATWYLPPLWFSIMFEFINGLPSYVSQYGLTTLGAITLSAVLLVPAIKSFDFLLSKEIAKRKIKRYSIARLWPKIFGKRGAIMHILFRHLQWEERLKQNIPPLYVLLAIPFLIAWYRPGEMSHIISPDNQVTWGRRLMIGFSALIPAIGILGSTSFVHQFRYAKHGDGGLRFLSLPIDPLFIHRCSLFLTWLIYLGPITILYGLTVHLLFHGVNEPLLFKYTITMIVSLVLDCLLAIKLDTILNPALPLSKKLDSADNYPAWISIFLPAVGLGLLSGSTYKLMTESSNWWMPLGIGLPALKLIILLVLTSIEKKRLLNLR